MENNIFLKYRQIVWAISDWNRTAPGEKHKDGLSYPNIDDSVATSMFCSDLRNGTNLYYPRYPRACREAFAALKPEDIAAMSAEFYAKSAELYKAEMM